MKRNKIVDANPAPYPNTNTAEIKAVVGFVSILNLDRVKPDAKFLDKVPNTDGTVEIVSKTQIPIGKLEIQIKALEEKNYLTPKYQCELDFLSYCENSILPVILIVVNIKKKVAYWHHIDEATLKDLMERRKKNSVNLNFSDQNIIRKSSNKYIREWTEIIETYQNKLYDYDKLQERSRIQEKEFEQLKSVTNKAIGKRNPIYVEVHKFLDIYNGLLDTKFETIKNILYPNAWKIGMGIYDYRDHSARFAFYPVSYDLNDVLIKQFNSKDEDYVSNIISYIGFYSDNPIKNSPSSYAFKLIQKDTENVFEKSTFLIRHPFVAKEYLLAFIDRFENALGLDKKQDIYQIEAIEFALSTYLPMYMDELYRPIPGYKSYPIALDIDSLVYSILPSSKIRISRAVREKVKKGAKPRGLIKFYSDSFSMSSVYSLLAYLRQTGVYEISREYEKKNNITNRMYFTWEAFGEDKTIKNMQVFYKYFVEVYTLLVRTYFPLLEDDLRFDKDFDRMVVVIDFSEVQDAYGPVIKYYYLKSVSKHDIIIDIFNSSDSKMPFSAMSYAEVMSKPVEMGGIYYNVVRWRSTSQQFIYGSTPLLTEIHKVLKEKLEKYFESRI